MYEYFLELQTAAAAIGTSASSVEIVLCIIMNKSLHAIWILVHTLQFAAFFGTWQIPLHPVTRAALRELRRVVLAEYMDDVALGRRI